MIKLLHLENRTLKLVRYPATKDLNLRPWSSAELLAHSFIEKNKNKTIYTFNDRFGVWNCLFHQSNIRPVITHASQKKAIHQNLSLNSLDTNIYFVNPLDAFHNIDIALIKIPKSLDLFEFFLHKIHLYANQNTEVVCCFMTKYFSTKIVSIARLYFHEVEQTKAWKKGRLLVLRTPKKNILDKKLLNTVQYKGNEFLQYYGVFSSAGIDKGTKFLLEHLRIKENEIKVLDLGCGNGIIGYEASRQNLKAEVTLVDDFILAIESCKLNLRNSNAIFKCIDTLEEFKKNDFDIVVSNPPFHFEFENNIEVSLSLFKMVYYCLRNKGRFVLVANKHLNYRTHLSKIFSSVLSVKENQKFIIYECIK